LEVTETGTGDSRRQAVRPLNPLARHLLASVRIANLGPATIPAVAWWAINKLRLYPSPVGSLETLAQRGTELLVICGESDAKQSRWAMRHLERSGRCHFEVVRSMDHSLFRFAGRSELMRLLTRQVLEKLVPDFGPPDARASKEGSPTGYG
jgi:CelD/BcsL family acetyltransferase involved in cellulose biosynthesis